MGHLVGQAVDFGVAQYLFAIDQERAPGVGIGLRLQAIGQGIQVPRFDQRTGSAAQVEQCLGLLAADRLLGHGSQILRQVHCVTSALACQLG
ncbi:hypothetical protein D9M71_598300 [compost metagenome]